MTWIGMTDRNHGVFNPAGLGASHANTQKRAMEPYQIITRGTLVIETGFTAQEDETQDVLLYGRTKEWRRELEVRLTGAGEMKMSFRQGDARTEASLRFPIPNRDTKLRLYFSWNGPERWGRIAVKDVSAGTFQVAQVTEPLPMPMLDALSIMRNGGATTIGSDTAFIAISDEIEPVGLSAGICAGTPVETPSGEVPVERLRLGDHVITAGSGVLPVRWITKRTVPAMGGFRPVRLRAPYFGLEKDICLSPEHRIRIGGADAEYMLGREDVLLDAGRLLGSHAAEVETGLQTVTYYQILLDRHDCLLHRSVWLESLYVGQIAMDPERLGATTLADLPQSAIPTHRGFARHRLSDIEARSLASVLHR